MPAPRTSRFALLLLAAGAPGCAVKEYLWEPTNRPVGDTMVLRAGMVTASGDWAIAAPPVANVAMIMRLPATSAGLRVTDIPVELLAEAPRALGWDGPRSTTRRVDDPRHVV